MNFLTRLLANKPNQYWMLIGFGFAFLTLYCATTSNAKIDPKSVVVIWLFDEGSG